MSRLSFRDSNDSSEPPSGLGEIISVENWKAWRRKRICKIAGTPSIDFLLDLAHMLEIRSGIGPSAIDLEKDHGLWQEIFLAFDAKGQPVSLQQIVDDIELWPRGKGFIIGFLSDGRKEAIIRDTDGKMRWFEETEISFINVPAPLRDTNLYETGFGILGTLASSFDLVNAELLQKAKAVRDDSGQPAPVTKPVIVVSNVVVRKGGQKALLFDGHQVVRSPEAWNELQELVTNAGVSLLAVVVFGVDEGKYSD